MFRKVFLDDLVLFTQHLGSAVRAGVPLHQTVELLAGEMVSRYFRQVLADVAKSLRAGESLYESLSPHPDVFPEFYLRVVRAGEESGTLAESLPQLSNLLLKNHSVGLKLRRVFAYPLGVLLVLIGASVAYQTYLLPQIVGIYHELGAEIPDATRFLIQFQFKAFAIGLGFFLIAAFLARRFARVGWFGMIFDKFDLNFPFLGVFTRYALASRLSRSLATMLRAGIPLPEAMSLCGSMLSNNSARKSIEEARQSVERGETFGTALLAQSLFPPTMIWLISAAEVKGDFVQTLEQLADFYSDKVETTVQWSLELLEPILLLVVGGICVFMALGLYAPVFKLYFPIFNLVSAIG